MSTVTKTIDGPEVVQRFGLNLRFQHLILMLSTMTLIITGIPMFCFRHPELLWWTSAPGTMDLGIVREIHRWAGAALTGIGVYHMLWIVYTRAGRREFIYWLPKPKDFIDVIHMSMFFLFLRKDKPKFDRYAYFEKFDYWAVYWGCVIMCGTGLLMWFDKWAVANVPWMPYSLSALIHADEAVLATLAIVIWHFYNVHYNPHKFPGSMLWFHGKMTKEEMLDEHPLEYERIAEEK